MNRNDAINWNFKQRYISAGYTLTELGKRAQINPTYLSLFARGKYNLDSSQLQRISLLLDVPINQLTG